LISAVVLCGGAGRRFGGKDKPLLELAGRPLVAHVLERLSSQVDEVLVSANRHLDRYEALGIPVVADAAEDVGPLAGIAAALTVCHGDRLFVCPGDSPVLSRELVAALDTRLREAGEGVDAVMANDRVRDQVLFLLLRRRSAPSLNRYLAEGRRSVHGWLTTLSVERCVVADTAQFFNINTPEDLITLEARWHSGGL